MSETRKGFHRITEQASHYDHLEQMELGEMLSQVGRLNPAEQVRVEEKTLSQRRTCVWGLGGALGRTQQVEP